MSEASSEDLVPPLEAGAAPYREEEEAAKKKKEKKKSPRASFCTWAAP
ncbi:TNFAIP2 isoform 5 [Pan troglodytes]|uniref:TNFAIP2 isoform 5 n=2 Tax=Hominidae TaxID=9604 RepID=A0A2J8SZI2_PONAB|nr:TNFAIP2 isoform 5 [Pan troglodytes]PNJ26187.1 TNFAIP2 isoform 5 [Pongo abelii]